MAKGCWYGMECDVLLIQGAGLPLQDYWWCLVHNDTLELPISAWPVMAKGTQGGLALCWPVVANTKPVRPVFPFQAKSHSAPPSNHASSAATPSPHRPICPTCPLQSLRLCIYAEAAHPPISHAENPLSALPLAIPSPTIIPPHPAIQLTCRPAGAVPVRLH